MDSSQNESSPDGGGAEALHESVALLEPLLVADLLEHPRRLREHSRPLARRREELWREVPAGQVQGRRVLPLPRRRYLRL